MLYRIFFIAALVSTVTSYIVVSELHKTVHATEQEVKKSTKERTEAEEKEKDSVKQMEEIVASNEGVSAARCQELEAQAKEKQNRLDATNQDMEELLRFAQSEGSKKEAENNARKAKINDIRRRINELNREIENLKNRAESREKLLISKGIVPTRSGRNAPIPDEVSNQFIRTR